MEEDLNISSIKGAVMCLSCFVTVEKSSWLESIGAWNNRPIPEEKDT